MRLTHSINCTVSSVLTHMGSPEVNSEKWPQKLVMQLLPKTIVSKFGGYFFRNSHSVLFQIQPGESGAALTNVMANGFAGVVHFTPGCDIKAMNIKICET